MYWNANIGTPRKNTMTLSKTGTKNLTNEEWDELVALKDAITYSPQTVSAEKMEKFTELMVRSLEGKGDCTPR
jgi:hypothetical protein